MWTSIDMITNGFMISTSGSSANRETTRMMRSRSSHSADAPDAASHFRASARQLVVEGEHQGVIAAAAPTFHRRRASEIER